VIIAEGQERAVFTGGSLLVGSAGRSDLLGSDRADSLARLQYGSVTRLARLPAQTGLYPTHGAGSFCTAAAAGDSTSTIGEEKRTNPVLSHPDEDSFVASHLSDLEPFPDYYARMGPINLSGPPPLPDGFPPRLDLADVEPGTPVVDTRPADEFAAGHLPGALNIPLTDQFGTWFGWLLDGDVRPVLVTDGTEATAEAVTQLARLGVDGLPAAARSCSWPAWGGPAYPACARPPKRGDRTAPGPPACPTAPTPARSSTCARRWNGPRPLPTKPSTATSATFVPGSRPRSIPPP